MFGVTAEDARRDPELDDLEIPLEGLLGATSIIPKAKQTAQEQAAVSPPVAIARSQPAEPRPAASKHPASLVRLAKHYYPQATDSQIEGLSTEQLELEVEAGRRQAAAWDLQNFLNQRAPAQAQRSPEPPEPPKAAEPDYENWETLAEDDTIDPRIRQMSKLLKTTMEENKQLKDSVQQEQLTKQQRAYIDRIDSCFAKHKHVYGDGSFSDSSKIGRKELARRQLIDHLVRTFEMKSLDFNEVEKRAELFHTVLFDQPAPPPAPPKRQPVAVPAVNGHGAPRYTPEQWQEAEMLAPTNRTIDDLPPGAERATRRLATEMHANGIPTASEPRPDELDGFFN